MTHLRGLVKVLTLLVLVAAGCKEAEPTHDVLPDSSTPATSPALEVSALSITVQVPSGVAAGAPVPVTMIVRNVSQQPVYLATGDSTTTFDVRVADRFGTTVWRRMHERESLAALHERTLAPGDEVRFTDTWDQRSNSGAHVPRGNYVVHGTLDAQGDKDLETAPVHLQISDDL